MLGGLVVSTVDNGKVYAHKINVDGIQTSLGHFEASFYVTVVLPDFHIPTREARKALPKHVSIDDAVHNISRAVLITEAFRTGDLDLLARAMTDTLHHPYRLPLIPGAQEVMEAARKAGAPAVALSGAGPSLIAFSAKPNPAIGEAMKRAFEQAGLQARVFPLRMSNHGAEVHI
jgi:homoserine kinase